METGWALVLLFWGRNSCTGELPKRVMAALAQDLLSHAKPLRRDREMREKVLNYPTKLRQPRSLLARESQTEKTLPPRYSLYVVAVEDSE